MRAGRYDLVIDLQATDRSRILLSLLWLGGRQIRYRIGNNREFPYNVQPVDLPRTAHGFDRMRAALQAGGIPTHTERPVLHIPARNRERAGELMRANGLTAGTYAVLFPGSQAAGYLKRWGAERYAALAQALHRQGLQRIAVIGGPDEIDECRRIAALCAGPWLIDLAGRTEILDIVPICEGARLMVANDTGTAHVASATGRPLLVICGPTDPARVKPLGAAVTTLQAAALPCINCYAKTCPNGHACMSAITPQLVLETLQAQGAPPGI